MSSCAHSNTPPEPPIKTCPGGPYHFADANGQNCRECDITNMDATNGWDWEKDQRRGYCPQPNCGVFIPDLPESEWPEWYRASRTPSGAKP